MKVGKVFYKPKYHPDAYDLVISCCSFFVFRWWQILHSFESIALWSLFSRLDLAGVESLQVKRLRHLSVVVLAVLSGLGSSEQKPWLTVLPVDPIPQTAIHKCPLLLIQVHLTAQTAHVSGPCSRFRYI